MIIRVCFKAEQNAEFVFPYLRTGSGSQELYVRNLSLLFRGGITGNLAHLLVSKKHY